MRVVITGGAGFIGSHIAEALCRSGADVVVVDDLSLGSLDNLNWAKGNDRVEFVKGSVLDSALLRKLLLGCDVVFHQAAWPSVPMSVSQPVLTDEINLHGTVVLLNEAANARVKRFIFASSSAVYGDVGASLCVESQCPAPQSPYALQKLASEFYCRYFYNFYGLPTVCLRYFNVFGPRQSFTSQYSGVIAKFCTACIKGETPVVFGDGLQSRDFVYIDNVVDANILAANAPAEKVAGRVFNIAGGQSVTLLDLLKELENITGLVIRPKFETARPGDIRHSRADISLARSAFGFEPIVDWRAGLRKTFEFYKSNISGERTP